MKVIVLSGPTATGKTEISLELAARFGGEVVNFDSLLLYREINIGTAKPTPEERGQVPHHMIDVRSISRPMNAADYAAEARPMVENLLAHKKTVILVGGSGFYLQALLKGMYDSPTTPPEILLKSDALYKEQGIAPFLSELKCHDPESFQRYHENDHYRIRRALEHWWANKTKFSEQRKKKDSDTSSAHAWEIYHAHLDLPREEHQEIIRKRTRRMLENGLLDEVRDLLGKGFTGLEKPFQSIGYKEILAFHFGVFKSLSECEERIIISTRQLAKSQRTWFNRDPHKQAYHPLNDHSRLLSDLSQFL